MKDIRCPDGRSPLHIVSEKQSDEVEKDTGMEIMRRDGLFKCYD